MRDRAMMDLLLPLGIEKGKEFKPDAEAHRNLAQSACTAHAWPMNALPTLGTAAWRDASWALSVPPVAPFRKKLQPREVAYPREPV